MTIDVVRNFLLWCMIINLGSFFLSFFGFTLAPGVAGPEVVCRFAPATNKTPRALRPGKDLRAFFVSCLPRARGIFPKAAVILNS